MQAYLGIVESDYDSMSAYPQRADCLNVLKWAMYLSSLSLGEIEATNLHVCFAMQTQEFFNILVCVSQ